MKNVQELLGGQVMLHDGKQWVMAGAMIVQRLELIEEDEERSDR